MLRVLVVDDDAGVRKTLMHLLMLNGFMVITTGDCEQAMAMCEDMKPEVVMVDMHLNHASGVDVVGRLQEMVPKPYVIAMTGDGQETLDRAVAMGADEVLSKPFGMEEMMEKLRVSVV